jgi:cytochrome c oxidase subunit 3
MSAVSAPAAHAVQGRLRFNRLGLWLFLVTEVFMFGGFLVMRFHLWGNTRPELDQALGLIVTSILLVSSYFMNRAEMAVAHDDRPNFLWSLALTGLLGALFLVGVVGFEWRGHVRPTDGVYGAVLYGMTGMHALHVLTGLVIIFFIWRNGRRGRYSSHDYWGVEFCAIYWHFVDVVWVFFYPALYLIGTVAHF